MGCLSDTTTQHERSSVFPQRNCSSMLRNIYKLVIALNSQEGKKAIFDCAFGIKLVSAGECESYWSLFCICHGSISPFLHSNMNYNSSYYCLSDFLWTKTFPMTVAPPSEMNDLQFFHFVCCNSTSTLLTNKITLERIPSLVSRTLPNFLKVKWGPCHHHY